MRFSCSVSWRPPSSAGGFGEGVHKESGRRALRTGRLAAAAPHGRRDGGLYRRRAGHDRLVRARDVRGLAGDVRRHVLSPVHDALPHRAALSRVGRDARHPDGLRSPDGHPTRAAVGGGGGPSALSHLVRFHPLEALKPMALPVRKFDAVIVGAGGSGMLAALELAMAGSKVAVLSKVFPTRSHTVAAQGGVGAALGNMGEDSWLWHMYDTIKGSDYLGDQDAIEFMCRMAPEVVIELEHFGMPFDRNENGTVYQRPFGGHSANFGEKPVQRSCCAADRTGHAMLHTLYQRNVLARTQFFVEWMALDLIRDAEGHVLGVTALEMETGETTIFHARATLFATGGARRRFPPPPHPLLNTRPPPRPAARARPPPRGQGLWQFHPTGVAGAGGLITEGVRGEGGYRLNKNGGRFMERYGPTLEDLAS